MTLTSIPLLLAAVAAPVPATGPAQVGAEDPPQTIARQAPPPVAPWAFRMSVIPRFPGGMGFAGDISRAFGEYFSLEASAGVGDYTRSELGLLARVNSANTGGGATLAVGPLLMNSRLGTIPFAVGEIGYTSSRRRGIFVLAAIGAEVALAKSQHSGQCPFLDLACPGRYYAGDVNLRARLGIGAAF